jgi:hypothetical protein
MARIRTIKPDFFTDDDLGELSPLHRLLFAGLWCHSDGFGRLKDKPKKLKVQILPYDDADIDEMLNDLEESGFVIRYDSDGTPAIQIVNFRKHQRITGKEAETPSLFLAPPDYIDEEPIENQEGNNGETTEKQPMSRKGKERKGKESNREWKGVKGENREQCLGNASTGDESDPILFDVQTKEGKLFEVKQSLIDSLSDSFPTVDVIAEVKHAIAWINSKTANRKTHGGMERFFVNWLGRAKKDGQERQAKTSGGYSRYVPQSERDLSGITVEDF